MRDILLFVCCFCMFACSQENKNESFRTVVVGTVMDRDSEGLMLESLVADSSFIGPEDMIPIVDGKFQFTMEGMHMMQYRLIFEEEWRAGSSSPIYFYPDADTIKMTLYPRNRSKENIIEGGELNTLLKKYNEGAEELWQEMYVIQDRKWPLEAEGKLLTEEGMYYEQKIKEAQTDQEFREYLLLRDDLKKKGTYYSAEGQAIEDEMGRKWKEINNYWIDMIRENINPVTYSIFFSKLQMKDYSYEQAKELSELYAPAYAAHIFTPIVATIVEGMELIRPGKLYPDIHAPDMEGNMYSVLEQTAGKIALVDLWGSWCSTCRVKSKQVIPLYEEYKDKGFTVVGIAREFKNTDALKIAIEKDGYPWLNLVDLDDTLQIWDRHALTDSAGMVILLDREGTIVAVNPSVEEIKTYLEENIG